MLRKLLKYDLKWIYKVVAVFYVLTFLFSIIGRGLSLIENSALFFVLSKISYGAAIAMMVNCLINCLIRIWVRFIKNIYKDESYLTHTLPVDKKTIFASKILSAIISLFTSIVVIIANIFICYYSKENFEALKEILKLTAVTFDTTVLNLLLIVSVIFFLEILSMALVGILGIILGHKFNKNKILASIIISMLIYFGMQIVTLLFLVIFGLFNPEVMNFINTTEELQIQTFKNVMYVFSGVYLIYIIINYILGKKEFEKGVNVD